MSYTDSKLKKVQNKLNILCMRSFINMLRIVAIFIFVIGAFYKVQDSPDADNLMKGALFILMFSVLLWVITRIRKGKGAY